MKTEAAPKSKCNSNEDFIKAAGAGRLAVVKQWIAEGRPVMWPAPGKITALMSAAENGQLEVVKMLIEARSELDAQAVGKRTAIALAAARGHEHVVKALLIAGADPNVKNKEGETTLALAKKSGNQRLVSWLESRWARDTTSESLDKLARERASQFRLSRQTKSHPLSGKAPTANQRKSAANEASRLLKEITMLVRSGAQGGDYALSEAAVHGDSALAVQLLKARANPNYAPHISSALSEACQQGHLKFVRLLLDAGANVDYGGTGDPPILEATRHRHLEVVRELIRRGAKVDNGPKFGATPLLAATAQNNLPMMKVLLQSKADPNQKGTVEIGPRPKPTITVEQDIEGSPIRLRTTHYPKAPDAGNSPPVVVATRCNHLGALKVLIKHGTNLEATDNAGKTALAWARKLGLKDIESVLIKSGASSSIDLDGSALNALIIAATNGNLNRVKELLSAGADANAHLDSENGRKTPLAAASGAGHSEIVRALLSSGADPNKPVAELAGARNQTPLMLAAQGQHVPIVKMLLAAKADVNAVDFNPFGAGEDAVLHYAARGGNIDVIDLLLRAGALPSIRNKMRETPLQVASAHGHERAMDLLLHTGQRVVVRKGKVSRLLNDAAFTGNLSAVKRLLAANPNSHGHDIEFACSACSSVKPEIVRTLVDSGMPVDGQNVEGDTPLISAIMAGRFELVRFLLSRGADPTRRSREGKTPMDVARQWKNQTIIGILREKNKGN